MAGMHRSGLPLSLSNVFRRMYTNDYMGLRSVPGARTTPDGCVILRQYLIPNNPESRIFKSYKKANPNCEKGGGILIPVSVDNKNTSMGAFLDKPRTEKSNESGHGSGLNYGIAAMQGWRVEMEDAHTARVGLEFSLLTDWAFFSVFDGHAGGKVAKYCASNLLESILDTPELKELLSTSSHQQQQRSCQLDQSQVDTIVKGIKRGFLNLDDKMRRLTDVHGENEKSGSTVISALISPSHIFLANLGDSRAVFSRNGRVQSATEDHKPSLPKERDRIVNAGGSVMIHRVNGSLAVSRALGDYEYKNAAGLGPCQQMVSPEPDVLVLERDTRSSGKDEFLLMACDGVFDVMGNAEVCDFVRNRLRITDRLELICNQVLDSCLSKGSRDNMSVILVTFPGAPKISKEAVDKEEREFEVVLRERIFGILNIKDSETRITENTDIDYLMRVLTNGDTSSNFIMQHAADVQSLRTLVQSILDSLAMRNSAIMAKATVLVDPGSNNAGHLLNTLTPSSSCSSGKSSPIPGHGGGSPSCRESGSPASAGSGESTSPKRS